jgi:hypothetical protein
MRVFCCPAAAAVRIQTARTRLSASGLDVRALAYGRRPSNASPKHDRPDLACGDRQPLKTRITADECLGHRSARNTLYGSAAMRSITPQCGSHRQTVQTTTASDCCMRYAQTDALRHLPLAPSHAVANRIGFSMQVPSVVRDKTPSIKPEACDFFTSVSHRMVSLIRTQSAHHRFDAARLIVIVRAIALRCHAFPRHETADSPIPDFSRR